MVGGWQESNAYFLFKSLKGHRQAVNAPWQRVLLRSRVRANSGQETDVSDTDSFIEEVTEEVRREQLFKYVRRYGWIAIVLVLGVVALTAYYEYQKATTTRMAQELGDRLVSAIDEEDPAARAKALAVIAPEAGDARIIVDLRRASDLVDAGDTSAAIEVFESVANSGANAAYADMALLKAIILKGKDQDATERDATLAQLAAPGALYRPLAMEQQGLFALSDGNQDKAVEIFTELYQDSEITDALQNRATQMLVALGADVPTVTSLLPE